MRFTQHDINMKLTSSALGNLKTDGDSSIMPLPPILTFLWLDAVQQP